MLNGFGWPHLLIIAVLLIVLFGAKRLPDAARGIGRSMHIFKSEVRSMQDENQANTPPAGPPSPPAAFPPPQQIAQQPAVQPLAQQPVAPQQPMAQQPVPPQQPVAQQPAAPVAPQQQVPNQQQS